MPANRLKRQSIVKYQELRKLDRITLFALKDKHVKLVLITSDAYSFASCVIIQITPPTSLPKYIWELVLLYMRTLCKKYLFYLKLKQQIHLSCCMRTCCWKKCSSTLRRVFAYWNKWNTWVLGSWQSGWWGGLPRRANHYFIINCTM